jgi:energy-coupling factor transporter transmembrane protein EcfT
MITKTGLNMAILRTSRLAGLILASKLLVLTMSMEEMINTLKEICSPLNRLRLPVNEFFDTTLLTIQFIPFLKKRLVEKYNSNTTYSSPKNFFYTASALIPILIDGIKDPESYIENYKEQNESSRKQSL